MRVLVDYRPALRNPTGVGEYTRQLVSALATDHAERGLDLTIFSSSWKDRLQAPAALARVEAVDLRVPVAVLNLAWHRLALAADRMADRPPVRCRRIRSTRC